MDSIANFRFISLSNPPELVQAQMAAHTRSGTDGVTVHHLGSWAEPFFCTSRAEAQSMEAALQIYREYLAIVGQRVRIVWANVPFAAAGFAFFVMKISEPRPRKLLIGTGPNGDYFADLEVTWRLQCVKV